MADSLIGLEKPELQDLGEVLGLFNSTVRDKYHGSSIKEYRDSILHCWLIKCDEVVQKGGATWRILVSALNKMNQGGLAEKIECK